MSVGYNTVAAYDQDGHLLVANGPIGDGDWLPRAERGTFFLADDGKGGRLLLTGASKRFESNGKTFYAFVANLWDGVMIDTANSVPGLVVVVYAVADGRAVMLNDSKVALPPRVLSTLSGGVPSMVTYTDDVRQQAAGFAALRDLDGNLVGIVACRLANQLSLLSHVRRLELFLALWAMAGFISLLVALSLSALISRPLTQLNRGLLRVRDGDFKTRVAETGGGELTALAIGFNRMAAQLEAMRQREALVRRREQLATLGEAAAVLAHEIRNPLGIIKTSSQVLRQHSCIRFSSISF